MAGTDSGGASAYWGIMAGESRPGEAHFSPSAARNTEPILAALAGLGPAHGHGLEVASGTGQHAVALAGRFPDIDWTPSDPEAAARASIAARRAEAGLANLAAPLDIDLTGPRWHEAAPAPLSVLVAINVIHISPWAAATGLLDGAAAALAPRGILFIYGCFARDGDPVSASNVAFDGSLRARNAEWGVRDTADLVAAAEARGLEILSIMEMPANNTALAFRPAAG